ncbi:DsbA family oxidoreductase [Thalassotalea sp. HSM 43]|uniref:DsbA family oxidoreductase n=1 Tax=Thalassotalea sp. HSM 43 TaxID=2552945 RepID=UPI0010806BA8|nr:DsbA family oxidoreductase [Thalassotalea sp. HSM 43]QBY03747.1 DsbA family oxidoreductase [Thalassotalea sp. HSM 43]
MLKTLSFDIVSDVVCPWCIVGFKRLEQALKQFEQVEYQINWYPFELNPDMPSDGQNLREHLIGKYQISVEESQNARENLRQVGAELDIEFNFSDDMRIVNTLAAHQLLHHAKAHGLQHALKMALFDAYFSQRLDISDHQVLMTICQQVSLPLTECEAVLHEDRYLDDIRSLQQQFHQQNIQAVPAFIINGQYLISGAHPVESWQQILTKIINEEVQ